MPLLLPAAARAAEHITLTNGFEMNCVRREPLGESGRVRLYPIGAANANPSEATNYIEVAATAIRMIEPMTEMPVIIPGAPAPSNSSDIRALLIDAGARHHIDVDLLASLVSAESAGHINAVSRAGARGLMQLMPSTAAYLGVQDSMRADQNIAGGTAYLDQLLTRYHDDITLALAAYNAGPGAVDRYHGVPPFRETRAYVARIINEFNRRKQMALQISSGVVPTIAR